MSENRKFFFIAGNPVSHSKSPQLFEAYTRDAELPHLYVKALCTKAEDVELLLRNGFSGGNITAPLKEDILTLGFAKSQTVEKIRAANTVYSLNGEFFLENTDVQGVEEALKHGADNLTGGKAVVVGSGGAGRAAILALQHLGCEVAILNRTMEKANYWAEMLGCRKASLYCPGNLIKEAQILVNTLSFADNLVDEIHSGLTVLDADYKHNPLKVHCENTGASYISGTSWLIWQAVYSYRFFGGKMADPEILSDVIQNSVNPKPDNIILTGMMKSGKTTTGRKLAEKTGWKFIDTDELVEQRTGKSIAQIFEEDDEAVFRQIEHLVFSECIKNDNQVISTGGGLILNQKNRELIKVHGTCIWLFASPETLESRQDNGIRPLYGKKNDSMQKILNERFDAYAKSSDIILPVENITAEKAAELIIAEITG
jgi:shikimate dehydrogenase